MKHTLLTLGIIALMCSCSRQESLTCKMETINSLEDMKEYMEWDLSEGRIDSSSAESYFLILDESLINLYKTK